MARGVGRGAEGGTAAAFRIGGARAPVPPPRVPGRLVGERFRHYGSGQPGRSFPHVPGPMSETQGPNGVETKMKIAQCWDDGVLDDLRLIEILRRHGAKASFNLNLGTQPAHRQASWRFRDAKDVWKLGRDELREVYEGFPIANHSARHLNLTKVAPEEAYEDIRVGRDLLEQFFGFPVTGFVYPCGLHSEEVEQMVAATGHVYARTTKNVARSFPPERPMALHSNCHFAAADFWDRFARAKAEKHPVFYFWGHSYEMIADEEWAAMDAKIARVSADPECEWTTLPELFADGPAN